MPITNTVSIDSGTKEVIYAVRKEMEQALDATCDTCELLIRLESAAERQWNEDGGISNKRAYISAFIKRHITQEK